MYSLYILWTLGVCVAVTSAAHTVAVPDYSQASAQARALVDQLVANYRTFSRLELLENIPRLDDPERCNQNKQQYIANLGALLEETRLRLTSSDNSDTIQIDTKEGKKIFPFYKKRGETNCQKTLTTKVLKMALQNKYADIIANLPVEQLEELRNLLVQRPEFSQLTSAVQSGFQDIVALKVSLVEKEVLLSKLLKSYLIKAGYLLPHMTHTT